MTEGSDQRIRRDIEETADFYQPAVYELLSFYHALELRDEPLDGQFVPLTTVQPWEQGRTVMFAVGLIPPSSNVSRRLLDRTASIRTIEGNLEEIYGANPDVSSSSTGDLPGETSGIATSTTEPNGPTSTGSKDFWVQYVAMCNRLGCQPEELARVVQAESGWNPAAGARNKDGKVTAKGLIQFVKSTATSEKIGMTPEQWENMGTKYDDKPPMPREEQLIYMERFYAGRAKGKNAFQLKLITLGGFNNPDGSIYHGDAREPEYKNAEKQRQAYERNSMLDRPPPPKGYLTPEDIAFRLKNKKVPRHVLRDINKARRELGMAVGYEPFQPDGASSGNWANSGSQNANKAFKTAWEVANKNLNTTELGKRFMEQQQAMINQTIAALDTMAKTPPLRLLVNPQSFRVSAEKLIADGNWGRNGPIIEHWGENQDTIEASGKVAAFYALDTTEGNSPGLTRTARQFSASYQNLLSLWLIYKNNGGVYFPDPLVPQGSRAKNLSVIGSVYLYYDGILYIGSFDTFNLTEADGTPFTLEYTFGFTVRAWFILDHLDDHQYNYGRPTVPALPVGSSSPPLSTGNNEQPAPEVPLPPEIEEERITEDAFARGGIFDVDLGEI